MTKKDVLARRNKVSQMLAKSISKPADLAKTLDLDVKDVQNDLYWMRKESKPWLSGYALDGYVFVTRNSIAQLEDIEVELQEMRQKLKKDDGDKTMRLRVMGELRETINTRWVMQGEGPTLMQAYSVATEHEGK